MSSAGAAASIAASNRKSFEHWKPEPIPAANKAAFLAKDHKMDPLWKPEASAAGSKAAMAAAAHPTEVEPLQPKRTTTIKSNAPSAAYDTAENTHQKALMAATASHNRRRSGSLPVQPVDNQNNVASWALKAATKSHKDGQVPVGGNFTTGDPGFEAARIQNVAKNNVNRQLYSSTPPVAIEVQEKNRQDTLRASAVAMAQKMYALQQKQAEEAASKPSDGHALAASRHRSSTAGRSDTSSVDYPVSGAGYENLEEAARKLAQERLAKIHDEHAEYRNYYGQSSPPKQNRLSMRLRPRASSAVTDDSDEEQSRRIRSQMSIFKSNLAEVDGKKRQSDRDALIQIAHRNVDAQIQKMDEKVFHETGKASPAQMEKWEKSAREKAQRDSDERMQNVGKVHIGGGKYLDQSELDAIARARLQPTLDEISDKAEKQRARDEEERLERERKLEQERVEKARAAETAAQVKADLRKLQFTHCVLQQLTDNAEKQKAEERARKDEEKRIHDEEKAVEKDRRRTEAAAEKERTRLAKDEKRKSSQHKPGLLSGFLHRGDKSAAPSGTAVEEGEAGTSTAKATTTAGETVPGIDGQTVHDQVTVKTDGTSTPVVHGTSTPVVNTDLEEPKTTGIADTLVDPSTTRKSTDVRPSIEKQAGTDDEFEPSSSPNKSRVKSWMKVKFSGRGDKQKEIAAVPATTETKLVQAPGTKTEDADQVPRVDSMRDVAMAGKTSTNETQDMYGSGREVSPERNANASTATAVASNNRRRSSSISSLSSDSVKEPPKAADFSLGTTQPAESDSEQRGRSGLKDRLMNKIKPKKDQSKEGEIVQPAVTNTTDDEFEEARDHFEEEKLEPPSVSSNVTGETSGTKTMSPKGSREGSKFKEEL